MGTCAPVEAKAEALQDGVEGGDGKGACEKDAGVEEEPLEDCWVLLLYE